MKKVFVKKVVKVNEVKSTEVQFNDELKRYYFVAVSPQRFDEKEGKMYASESVVIGDNDKQQVENLFKGFNNFFEINPEGYIEVEKREAIYIEENDDIAD